MSEKTILIAINHKLDKLIKNQEVIIQMLTDILESKKPNIKEVLKPMMENPLFKNNPVAANILENLLSNINRR